MFWHMAKQQEIQLYKLSSEVLPKVLPHGVISNVAQGLTVARLPTEIGPPWAKLPENPEPGVVGKRARFV